MDEERKQKTAALNSKKKLEGDLKDLESTMDMNNKMKEDAIKQLKKHQAALKELTRDADEAHQNRRVHAPRRRRRKVPVADGRDDRKHEDVPAAATTSCRAAGS